MKKMIILTILLSIFFILKVHAENNILLGRTICIDAGHGGFDPGATYKDLKEAEINLKYANLLKKELEKVGVNVYLIRQGDYDLSTSNFNHKRSDMLNRIRIIESVSPDIFISIHLNADSVNTWYGSQTFYNSINDKNKLLAEMIQKELKKGTNTKRNTKKNTNIFLLKNTNIPGVLVELGFITNAVDRTNLVSKDYQQKLTKLLVNGIKNYFLEIEY